MKIVTIVGARPQFIKCAPVSRLLRRFHIEILVHTDQHYDQGLSGIFFQELEIPEPNYHLGVGSSSHGKQTGEMLIGVENILLKEQPDLVLVYGDTNSTLAGALAAAKLNIPIAHVEAGLRSNDKTMPEEINRIIVDHISSLLLCPTITSINNLQHEGINNGLHLIGDVMVDALLYNRSIAEKKSLILKQLGLYPKTYLVLTFHRPSNTDMIQKIQNIILGVSNSSLQVIFPVHPRTRKSLENSGIWMNLPNNIKPIEPLGYLDMLNLMNNAIKIVTDSGGIQKEAYLLGVPCITLRDNTEWIETVQEGWNVLVGANKDEITKAIVNFNPMGVRKEIFGIGAADKIVLLLSNKRVYVT